MREGLERSLDVQEREAGPAREHVYGSLRVLVANGVADFAIDERVQRRQAHAAGGEALVCSSGEGRDGPCAVAVCRCKVLGDFSFDPKALDEVDEESLVVTVRADEFEMFGSAGTVDPNEALRVPDCEAAGAGLEVVLFDGGVDCFFGHLAVGCPFTTSNGYEPTLRDVDQVVADKRFSVFSIRVFNKGADTRPGCKYIATAYVDVWSQVASDLAQNPVNFLFTWERMGGDRRWSVSSASNGVPLPRQEEDHAAIRGIGIDQTLESIS